MGTRTYLPEKQENFHFKLRSDGMTIGIYTVLSYKSWFDMVYQTKQYDNGIIRYIYLIMTIKNSSLLSN